MTKIPQDTADLVTFKEESLNGKLHFLCRVVGCQELGEQSKNTFDILANRWRKLWQQIKADIETVQLIVQASICLHNFLQLTFSTFYNPSRFFDTELSDGSVEEGNWRRIVSNRSDVTLLHNLKTQFLFPQIQNVFVNVLSATFSDQLFLALR